MHSQSSDPLAAVIELLRPQTILSKIVSGAGRWAVSYEAHVDPGFCLMLEGSCVLDVEGIGAVDLHEGDFVLLPATPGFVLASHPGVKPVRVSATHGAEIRHGTKTGPATMRQLGGYFRFDRANARLLVKFLPKMVLIRRGDLGAGRVRRLVELIAEETSERRPGKELVLERLVEVMLVEALRFQPEVEKNEKGLLAGLRDPGLAKALRRIHEDVADRWTVAELARVAGTSRAVFAERFMRIVGMPPMEYVLEWRIAVAKDLLRRKRTPLAEVAAQIGYHSASAFSTAFTRHTGEAPSAFSRASLHGA